MKRVKICDFADVITGGTPSTSNPEYWDNGDIPWLQSGACQNCLITKCDTFITQKGLDNSAAKMMKPDSVLIALTGATTGKVGFLTFEACANQSVTGIQPNERFVPKYLFYYLKGIRQKILDDSYGGAQKHISQGYVKDIEVPLGTISEQTEIADMLERIDKVISVRQQQMQWLDTIIKARFVEMFGDETNPYNWPIINVEDIATVTVGVVIKPAQYYTDADHGVKAFRSLNVGEMYIKDNDWVYFSQEGNDKNNKSQLHENDLLIIRSGAPGVACVVTKQYEGCNAIDIIIARPDTDKIDPYYLCMYTNMPHGKRQIEEGTGGAAQQHFNVGKYNKLRLMLPPIEKQKQFSSFIAQIDKSKVAIQVALDKTQLLFDSLMQKYFG